MDVARLFEPVDGRLGVARREERVRRYLERARRRGRVAARDREAAPPLEGRARRVAVAGRDLGAAEPVEGARRLVLEPRAFVEEDGGASERDGARRGVAGVTASFADGRGLERERHVARPLERASGERNVLGASLLARIAGEHDLGDAVDGSEGDGPLPRAPRRLGELDDEREREERLLVEDLAVARRRPLRVSGDRVEASEPRALARSG